VGVCRNGTLSIMFVRMVRALARLTAPEPEPGPEREYTRTPVYQMRMPSELGCFATRRGLHRCRGRRKGGHGGTMAVRLSQLTRNSWPHGEIDDGGKGGIGKWVLRYYGSGDTRVAALIVDVSPCARRDKARSASARCAQTPRPPRKPGCPPSPRRGKSRGRASCPAVSALNIS
jgi:hypothetical protein